MIVLLKGKAAKEDLDKASEVFGDYIKICIDISNELMAAGGKLHVDCEKILLEKGCNQENIWGGGFDLKTKAIDTQGLINIRPNQGNDNMEILDSAIRSKFLELAERMLK